EGEPAVAMLEQPQQLRHASDRLVERRRHRLPARREGAAQAGEEPEHRKLRSRAALAMPAVRQDLPTDLALQQAAAAPQQDLAARHRETRMHHPDDGREQEVPAEPAGQDAREVAGLARNAQEETLAKNGVAGDAEELVMREPSRQAPADQVR